MGQQTDIKRCFLFDGQKEAPFRDDSTRIISQKGAFVDMQFLSGHGFVGGQRRLRFFGAGHVPEGCFPGQGFHKCLPLAGEVGVYRIVALPQKRGQGFRDIDPADAVFIATLQNADALEGDGNVGVEAVLAAPGGAVSNNPVPSDL